MRSQGVEGRLTDLADELTQVREPQTRAAIQDQIRALKAEQGGIGLELEKARARESDLAQALQLEQSRWNELVTRLEQFLTKP